MRKKIVKATYGFIYKAPEVVAGKSSFIGTNVLKYPVLFGTLDPKPTDGMIIITVLTDAIDNNDGSKLAKLAIKNGKTAVGNLMRNWGPQVTILAAGDETVIAKSGFDNYKEPVATPDVFTPSAVIVKDTDNSGKVIIQVPVIPYADKYQYRYSTVENATEEQLITLEPGKRMVTVEALTPATVYYFSSRVFGKNGSISDWNEFIAYIVR